MADTGYTSARECVECGNQFEWATSVWGRPRKRCTDCSPYKASAERRPRPKGPKPKNIRRACLACGSQFLAATAKAKVCGPACRWRLNNPGWLPRAERYALRRAASALNLSACCQGCGRRFTAKRTDRTKYCSRECAFAHAKQWLSSTPPPRRKARPQDPVALLVKAEAKALRDIARRIRPALSRLSGMQARRAKAQTPCETCHAAIGLKNLKGGPRRFCSEACLKASPAYREARRTHRRTRKARMRNVRAEPVNAIKVFERDGWRCHLCGGKTRKDLRGSYHPQAPELDHVVPLAKGGDHSYANTACAHRACNAAKSDTIMGQPSLLSAA